MIPTPEQAWELLCEYNEGDFHRKHGRIVGDVLRWYANELGYGDEADFWQAVGILHDLDFEQWPEQHCTKEQELLRERGINLEQMKAEQDMADVDDFDFICHVAFDKKPLPRRERANNVKKRDFFSKYSGDARKVLEALLDKYMNTGIYEIEKTEILKLDPFEKLGRPPRIAALFGGRDGYLRAVRELENAIYTEEVG